MAFLKSSLQLPDTEVRKQRPRSASLCGVVLDPAIPAHGRLPPAHELHLGRGEPEPACGGAERRLAAGQPAAPKALFGVEDDLRFKDP